MKAILATIYVCLFCIVNCVSVVQASGQAKPLSHKPVHQRAVIYRLTEIHVADSTPKRYVWVVYDESGSILPEGEGAVYESLNSSTLRQWVSHLPAGSEITTDVWLNMSNLRISVQKRPITNVPDDPDEWADASGIPGAKEFARFCRGKGVVFLITFVSA